MFEQSDHYWSHCRQAKEIASAKKGSILVGSHEGKMEIPAYLNSHRRTWLTCGLIKQNRSNWHEDEAITAIFSDRIRYGVEFQLAGFELGWDSGCQGVRGR